MCILFIAVTPDTPQRNGEYKLVLAANRDEYFHRPAKIADYWDEHPSIVGGRDMEPGREGGTWLAMNKFGKIGVLLNILTDAPDPTKLGRGNLVKDFLTSSDMDGYKYSAKLCKDANKYNEFNLVTLDIKNPEPEVTFFSSPLPNPMKFNPTGTFVTAFGNSAYETPFLKVSDGEKLVKKLVENNAMKSQKRHLINGLLEILECKTRFHPDPQMQKQVKDIELLEGMSSRFVEMPAHNYGSRTHTVILVDFDNNVEFHEWTMMEPIDIKSSVKRWVHTQIDFTLN